MAAPAKQTGIELPPLDLRTMEVPIIGDSGLICHAWSAKAKKAMLDKQMKKATKGKEAKNPWQDFCETLYWLDGMPDEPTEADVEAGRFGFPSVAFKAAAITAVTSTGGMTKVMARQCFHVLGEFVEILGPPPSMREDMARVGMGTADIRHRAEFMPWGAVVPVQYNASVLSAEQVVQLFEAGGFGVGIGDWRPEKDGVSGRFHVAKAGGASVSVTYCWKPGSRIALDPGKAGRELEDIRQKAGGKLEQEDVVARARSANSALHKHFDWNDGEAAHKWRLNQAGEIIRAIVIDVSRSNVEPAKLIRAFVSVEQDGERAYTSTVVALSDAELRRQVVAKAWADLEAWRERHRELTEFARIFTAMDEAKRA